MSTKWTSKNNLTYHSKTNAALGCNASTPPQRAARDSPSPDAEPGRGSARTRGWRTLRGGEQRSVIPAVRASPGGHGDQGRAHSEKQMATMWRAVFDEVALCGRESLLRRSFMLDAVVESDAGVILGLPATAVFDILVRSVEFDLDLLDEGMKGNTNFSGFTESQLFGVSANGKKNPDAAAGDNAEELPASGYWMRNARSHGNVFGGDVFAEVPLL